jgi:hypothetical protein
MNWFHRNQTDRRRDDISTAEIARILDKHIEECRERTAEFHEKLDQHAADSDRKHEENLTRFAKIDRTIFIATGIAMAAVWGMTSGGTFLARLLK